jgi:hypothetical protein
MWLSDVSGNNSVPIFNSYTLKMGRVPETSENLHNLPNYQHTLKMGTE